MIKTTIDHKRNPNLFGYKPSRKQVGKTNEHNGKEAERIVMEAMKQMGFRCIEKIEVGYTVIMRGKVITAAFPKAKVSGDIRAVGSRGEAVHCEIQYRPRRSDGRLVLQYSDFEPHQIDHLQAVCDAKGLAFVAWVVSLYPAQLYFLEWPFPLQKRKALTELMAQKMQPTYFGFVNGNPV